MRHEARAVAFWLAAFAASSTAFGVASCGAGTCESPQGAPSCERTAQALTIADDTLAAHGFARVARLVDVRWVVADRLEAGDVPAGHTRLGHTEPAITRQGLRGEVTVATRLQTSIALTSFAHEAVHVSWVAGCLERWAWCEPLGDMGRGPYQGHTRPEWDEIVPAINAALAAKGL